MSAMIQYVLYLAILVVLAIPLGAYIKNVMSGEKTFLSKVLTPCENLIYKVMRVDREEQMTWKKYAVSVLTFSGVGLVFLFLLQLVQGVLPGNPQGSGRESRCDQSVRCKRRSTCSVRDDVRRADR